ncbi:oxidoreductase family protein [Vibrio astriarenae]|uniref:oxidoreductase family protein n=1 Tax=Vibrio astriarenae TaxID=1481923 RepID=UPI003736113D
MNTDYLTLLEPIGVTSIHRIELIQTLWSGYGELVRVHVSGRAQPTLIIKHVVLPEERVHPRGWNNPVGHQRKLDSYQVESVWYQDYCNHWDKRCPIPLSLHSDIQTNQWLIVIEDLNVHGYRQTTSQATPNQISACLYWLANFHAKYIGCKGRGLWESGTYWHLDTRPDELHALEDIELKQAAKTIDQVLKSVPFQTLVHGDAKLANFCFTPEGDRAAAVDFQYVGRGCAMKDVALFMSSAVSPEDCFDMESAILDEYFTYLKNALNHYQPTLNADEVETAWRPMFAMAWADFQRFVKGWSPNHWKINAYSEQLKERALNQLND